VARRGLVVHCDATRFPVVIVGTDRSGQDPREGNECEEQVHGFECGGSHFV
jgi:hypothetical protein